jgi:hypothetical protein
MWKQSINQVRGWVIVGIVLIQYYTVGLIHVWRTVQYRKDDPWRQTVEMTTVEEDAIYCTVVHHYLARRVRRIRRAVDLEKGHGTLLDLTHSWAAAT